MSLTARKRRESHRHIRRTTGSCASGQSLVDSASVRLLSHREVDCADPVSCAGKDLCFDTANSGWTDVAGSLKELAICEARVPAPDHSQTHYNDTVAFKKAGLTGEVAGKFQEAAKAFALMCLSPVSLKKGSLSVSFSVDQGAPDIKSQRRFRGFVESEYDSETILGFDCNLSMARENVEILRLR